MDGTSFEDNEEAFVDASGNLTSQAAAAMLTAKDGGEVRRATPIVHDAMRRYCTEHVTCNVVGGKGWGSERNQLHAGPSGAHQYLLQYRRGISVFFAPSPYVFPVNRMEKNTSCP